MSRACTQNAHVNWSVHLDVFTFLKWTDAAPLEAQRPSSCSPASQMGHHWYFMNILHSVEMAEFQTPSTAATLVQMIIKLYGPTSSHCRLKKKHCYNFFFVYSRQLKSGKVCAECQTEEVHSGSIVFPVWVRVYCVSLCFPASTFFFANQHSLCEIC